MNKGNIAPVALAASVIAWAMLAAACKKDPVVPESAPTPTDTVSPVPGGDTITPTAGKIADFYYEGGVNFPPLDSIRRYAFDPAYDSIYIYVAVTGSLGWTPGGFHSARDSLRKRFDISPKVRGGWGWMPHQILPDRDSTNIGVLGMIRSDSTWYVNHHYGVYPLHKNAKSVMPAHYDGSRVLKAGRSR